jgi:pimeloyl-ACP methyl ester carboxylesterase
MRKTEVTNREKFNLILAFVTASCEVLPSSSAPSLVSMSSSPTWTIHEHIIPASHPRGYRRGVRDPQTSRLKLHVKQYVPSRPPASPTAITLIFQHGMPPGAAKEPYEPFFWDLISHPKCPPVRAVWALDAAGFGQSFLLNKDVIGDEPQWFDSVEDVRHMINYFQDEMRSPLIGIGQSWGSVAMLVNASRHPRLFQAIILSDPVIE